LWKEGKKFRQGIKNKPMCRNDCKAKKSVRSTKSAGIWSGILLLLIPKCPFCFMAFSSVMVFCGGKDILYGSRTFFSATTLILTAIFCLTALLSIIIYYRRGRGKYALMLAITGITLLILSVTLIGGLTLYYMGALMLMAGLLRNSGLWPFIQNKLNFQKKSDTQFGKITFSSQ
jgi:hypothetical protein